MQAYFCSITIGKQQGKVNPTRTKKRSASIQHIARPFHKFRVQDGNHWKKSLYACYFLSVGITGKLKVALTCKQKAWKECQIQAMQAKHISGHYT